MKSSSMWWGGLALVLASLAGCGGSTPPDNSTPPPPPPPPVEVPTGTSPITLTAATPPATFAALNLKLHVGRVTIASAPVVDFSLTDSDGNAIIGFGSTSKSASATVASYPNLAFSLAKLVPGSHGSPSQWVSYIVSTVPTATAAAVPTRPSTDNTGALVDHQNGTYTYTFYRDITQMKAFVAAATLTAPNVASDLGDLGYDPTLTHRLAIIVSGSAPGTGSNTPTGVTSVPAVNLSRPLNVLYDFVPATGKTVTAADPQRVITNAASCNACHARLGGLVGTASASFHGGNRFDPALCTVCHTDQRKYGRSNVVSTDLAFPPGSSTYVADGATVGNLPVLVHKLHMGTELVKQNYNFGGVLLNETKFPQDVRNCVTCHDASSTAANPAPQGDNWKNVPNATACGACHDGIDFATGKGVTLADAAKGLTVSPFGHVGGARPDDSLCAACHTADAIAVSHTPVTPPDPQNLLLVAGGNANTNAASLAGNPNHLPAGAIAVSYDLKSVSVDAASGRPSMVFRMLQNGSPVAFNDPAAKAEIWDNFVGSPSAYFVFAVPQDGIQAPADFNAAVSGYLRNIWNGKATGTGAGTLAGPDANGYYTVTLTGVTIPADAVMVTGGLGYSYSLSSTQPLTQTNLAAYPTAVSPVNPALLTGGLITIAPDVTKVASGYSGRRAIVQAANCNACHQQLGLFTSEAFHAGQRNDGASCSWCHNPARTSSGWSADSAYFVHAIHGASKRTQPFTWHAVSAADSFATIGFPGILSNCEACHVPGSYDFSAAANAAAVPNRLYRTVATGTFTTPPAGVFTTQAPYVPAGSYGSGFSFNAATGVITDAAPTTLVISPITAACFACHDDPMATAHMGSNGGQIYTPRGAPGSGGGALGALSSGNGEACLVCHGPGKVADIKAVHPKP